MVIPIMFHLPAPLPAYAWWRYWESNPGFGPTPFWTKGDLNP